jgi:trimeric autotransporter adhesin
MDAAKNTLTKTALLLTFALLFLSPRSLQADVAATITTCGSVTFSGLGTQCTIATNGATFQYSTSISYAGDTASNWLSVNPATGSVGPGSSAVTLNINLSQNLLGVASHTATITVTPGADAPSGATPGTITVTFQPAGSGGGGGTGTITVDTNSLTFCPSGCQQTQYVNLNTGSTTAVPFVINAPSWMSVVQVSGTGSVSASTSPNQIVLSVNNYSQATSPATVSFTYSGGSASVTVYVSSAGSGGGTLSVNPTTLTWQYSTNGQLPNSQGVTIQDNSGAPSWSATVNTGGDPSWLNILYNGGNFGTQLSGAQFGGSTSASFSLVAASGSILNQLTTGTHTATVTVSDGTFSATITATILVNGGGGTNNGLTITPAAITLPSVGFGTTAQVSNSVSITSTSSGTLNTSQSGTCSGITPILNSTSIAGGQNGIVLTVYGNPTNLAQGTYNTCTISVNLMNGSQTLASVGIPITWVIGNGNGSGGGGTVANPVLPTALNFVSQTGSNNAVPAQTVTISASGNWTAATTYSSTQTGWITTSLSGSGPTTTSISVDPTNLSAGTYTGTVTYQTPSGSQAVTVTLSVYSNPVIYTNPGSISIQGANGTILGATSFQVLSSDGSHIPFTVSTTTSWLSLTSPASDTTSTFGSFQVNLSNLANGVYSGSINISAPTAANASVTLPVVLTVSGSSVTGGGSLTLSSSSLSFTSSTANPQTLTVTAPSGVTYNASASGSANGVTWLSISPSGFISTTSQNFQVTVTPGSLQAGTYSGTLTFTPNGGVSQNVAVTLTVSAAGTPNITASPTSLTFAANQGGSAPASQTVNLTSASGSAGVNFNLTTTIASGSTNWLSASVNQYTTPSSITVNANPTGLSAGTYNGTVVVTPFGGGATVNIGVVFNVSGLPTVSAAPTSLNLTYSVGGTAPTATLNVTGSAGSAGLNYTATVSSTCNCLSITPSSGNTATNPTITVSLTNPTSLTAGNYTGTITVSGTNGSTGNTTVNVTLAVTAPLPTITAIANAASGATGPLAPGEVISIFANSSNPIGPATPVALSASNLTPDGNVPLTMGGVTVTFNGRPAPLLYVSSTQINAVVPYGVAGFTNFPVTVKYLGQSSNGFNVQTTTTAPGIFTSNGQGSGPAAILNSNGSTNGNTPSTQPAAKGSTVSIFLTGEGATSPTGVDGKVTCGITGSGCSSLSQIPVPLLPVAVLIDGQPAALATAPGWVGYGEAPALVSGVLQVNAIIPTAARSGSVSLSIAIGGNTSQQNVTIVVQ